MQQPVSVQATGGIAVLTVDFPPQNALVAEVRAALSERLTEAQADPDVRAIVLAARGRNFATTPNLEDLDDLARKPTLAELCAEIERCPRPVVAALHGPVLGAGLELALAAHYRIADRRARMAFPEIRLGLPPLAGATQRLPRLVGVKVAVEMLSTGRGLDAWAAGTAGLVDTVAEGPLPAFVLRWIRERLPEDLPPRPTRARTELLEPVREHLRLLELIREKVGEDPVPARAAILSCVEAALLLPFEAGMSMEKAAYEDCFGSDVSRGLRHALAAEGLAARPPIESDARPRKLGRIGVVGAGKIGRGVAAACLDAGYPVTLVERDIDRLEEAVEAVIDIYDQAIEAKRLDAVTRDRRIGQLTGTVDVAAVADADLVIEATDEDAQSKRRILVALDAVMKRDALLATTTSGIDIDGLAAGTGRADAMFGLHFFPPAYTMRAVEVVVGLETSDEAVATAFGFVIRLGKLPVAAAVSEGYIAHRMAAALVDAGLVLMMQGTPVAQIDAAMEAYGFALGPFKLADAMGLDVLARFQGRHDTETSRRCREVLVRLCEAGRVGRRRGAGFYRYGQGDTTPLPDPALAPLLSEFMGDDAPLGAEAICRRLVAALANQGAFLLQDGISQRPSDIDLLMIQIFGYPRRWGGPMMAADLTGILRMKRDLESFAPEAPELWTPAPLWTELLNSGEALAALNG